MNENILSDFGNDLEESTNQQPESYTLRGMGIDVINSAQESSSFKGW